MVLVALCFDKNIFTSCVTLNKKLYLPFYKYRTLENHTLPKNRTSKHSQISSSHHA